MRICLIRCPSHFLVKDKVFPPLGLLSVGTVLQSQGHEVIVHDGLMDSIPVGCDYYGLGPTTPEYPVALSILRLIKNRSKSFAKVVLGGPHASTNCAHDGWDNIIIGDIADENVIPDRSLINIKSYKYFINNELATTLVTTIGCPYKCAFCLKTSQTVKFRSVEKVIEEINLLHETFGYKAFMFYDDIFMLKYQRVLAICTQLKELGIIWRCFVRADLVIKHGNELLDIMVDSGCVEVAIGIESGSDAILKNINKGETVEDIKTAINMIHSKGIRIKGFFIIGLPGENQETLNETEDFVSEMPLDDMDFAMFQPYSGTDISKNKDLYDIDWDHLDYAQMYHKGKPGKYSSLVRTSALSANQLIGARNRLEKAYGQI